MNVPPPRIDHPAVPEFSHFENPKNSLSTDSIQVDELEDLSIFSDFDQSSFMYDSISSAPMSSQSDSSETNSPGNSSFPHAI